MTNRKNENVTNFMETHIMYLIRRCWFLKCSEEIHYLPINDGWEEVLVRNVPTYKKIQTLPRTVCELHPALPSGLKLHVADVSAQWWDI
jgi:hypothetical protein